MKKLLPENLNNYLEFARTSGPSANFEMTNEEIAALATVIDKHPGLIRAIKEATRGILEDPRGNFESVLGTIWLTGFQMGREFESREQEENVLRSLVTVQ